MSLRRTLYSLLLYLIFPFVIFRLFWRSRSDPAYRKRIGERLGFVYVDSGKPIIWLHAVSVGETIAAQPLIEALIEQYSDYNILVTTTTPTGSERVKALFSDRVLHFYFPYDLPDVITRFINRVKPTLLVVIETEIWPNLYAKCAQESIPLIMVNARLSEHSAQRYLKVQKLVSETLGNVSTIAVRSPVDAERFRQLGVDSKKILVVGNLKFDFTVNVDQVEQGKKWRKLWTNIDSVWVAASTHEGEDEQILQLHQRLLRKIPHLMLVLVPRHPERFDSVYTLCKQFKAFKVLRHSQVKNYNNIDANIILGDSMGEMQSWFATADVVFMGGSLVKTGGHNPIEPVAQGVPVVSGPYMFNFDDISAQLTGEGLLCVCHSLDELEEKISTVLKKEVNIEGISQHIMQQHQGVVARLLEVIVREV